MTASTKTKTKPTKLTLAAEQVDETKSSIQALADELADLHTELAPLAEKGLLSPTELDRMHDLQDTLIPRREERLAELKAEHLPLAVAALRREELLELAGKDAGSIPGKHQAYVRRVEKAEEQIATALADIREAGEEWNTFVRPTLEAAKEAGQDNRRPADPEHPITVELNSLDKPGRERPLSIIVNGDRYRPAVADADVRRAAGRGDNYLAGLVREAHDMRVVTEGQRVQGFGR